MVNEGKLGQSSNTSCYFLIYHISLHSYDLLFYRPAKDNGIAPHNEEIKEDWIPWQGNG